MEIEDVEKNLMKVQGVEKAVVVPIFEVGGGQNQVFKSLLYL